MKEKLGYLVGGLLPGTAGKAILTSKDAKNLYTHCTAAVLRGKDAIMETAGAVRENAATSMRMRWISTIRDMKKRTALHMREQRFMLPNMKRKKRISNEIYCTA